MKTVKQEALQQAIENLSIILQDEDLTDEKLREYSEGLLPNTQDLLIKALNQDDWIRIENEEDLPKEDGHYWVIGFGLDYPTIDYYFEECNLTWLRLVSHYQPIQKPEPPIY